MRAENISPEMERTIIENWMSMRRSDYEPTAAEVRTSVVRQLESLGYTEYELPKLRTFQEYIRRAKKRRNGLINESDVDESQPWNLNVLNSKSYYIPPDTIPFVLQLWRYNKNLGPELTIRQAKWAARLAYLLKDLDIAEQWIRVVRYSREEELSILSNTQMKLDQLNAGLLMSPWEVFTLDETDAKFKVNFNIYHSYSHRVPDGGITEEFYYAFKDTSQSNLDTIHENKKPDDIERINKLNYLIGGLPSSSKYFPDYECRMVYLRHLAKLSRLPYWKTAKPEEIYNLVLELRAWVLDRLKTKVRYKNNPKKTSILGELPWVGGFPLDIYLKAGFSLEEDTNELEVEFRKANPDYFNGEDEK